MGTMDLFSPNKGQLFDEVRQLWVTATPEEQVRQRVLNKMIHRLSFPKDLLVVEKELKTLPHLSVCPPPNRRLDILCYAKDIHPVHPLYPLLLIECKEQKLDEQAIEQLTGYNAYVQACFIAVASREEERFGYLDKDKMKYIFHPGLPSYKDLIRWVKP